MNTYTIKDMHSKKEYTVRAASIDNLRLRLMTEFASKSGKHVDLMVSVNGRVVGMFQGPYDDDWRMIYTWRKANGDLTGIRPNGTIPPTR